jgi:prepilin-type N-terminal cleavage/methylation domain-containing protein
MIRAHRTVAARSRGFTLIEVMIAVAILALVMVMLAGSFHAVVTGKVHAENRLAIDDEGRAILSEMSDEIHGAVQTRGPTSRVLLLGQGRMQGGTPTDSIMVSTLDPGHRRAIEGFGAEDTISYTIAARPSHRGRFLLMRSQSSSLLGIGTGGDANAPMIIANNLLALHIRYFDGSSWGESWNSQSLPPGRELPLEVAIDLVLAAPGGAPLRLSTMVTLPMAFQQW